MVSSVSPQIPKRQKVLPGIKVPYDVIRNSMYPFIGKKGVFRSLCKTIYQGIPVELGQNNRPYRSGDVQCMYAIDTTFRQGFNVDMPPQLLRHVFQELKDLKFTESEAYANWVQEHPDETNATSAPLRKYKPLSPDKIDACKPSDFNGLLKLRITSDWRLQLYLANCKSGHIRKVIAVTIVEKTFEGIWPKKQLNLMGEMFLF